jgi:uroporphyrinogen decarboxylase
MGGSLEKVLRGEAAERRPIWLMRQAGRYLPEYRALRAQAGSFLDLCYAPEHAAEVTLQPLRRFDLDAAILFSDILVVPHAMGLKLTFVENEGPLLDTVNDLAGVEALKLEGPFWQFDRVAETVARVKGGLGAHHSLIGFCGAPWTVATYMIEGRSSDRTRSVMLAREQPTWFDMLIDRLIDVSVGYLRQQIAAGAEAIQIFDSWAGDLPESLRDKYSYQPISQVIGRLRESYPGFPVIAFARGVGAAGHAKMARAGGCNAVSVEQGVDLTSLVSALPASVAVQGNLDPNLLLATENIFAAGVEQVVRQVPMGRHIFNLGHGILPSVDPARVGKLVDIVRNLDGAVG